MNNKNQKREEEKDNSRQRLHGAFQGGFSAGYYNTVGSKEGWQPQQYSSKVKGHQQTMMDFMDEEDIKEFGGAVISNEYGELGSTQRELLKRNILDASSQLLQDIVKPLPQDQGQKIWNQMRSNSKRVGAIVPNPFKNILERKDWLNNQNTFGRSYDPFKNAPEFKDPEPPKPEKVKNRGFGTGIFEYEEDYGDLDDYDIPITNYNTVIMDEEDEIKVEQIKKPVVEKRRPGQALEGFVEQTRVSRLVPKTHLAPVPPKDYKPTPVFLTMARTANDKTLADPDSKDTSIFSFMNLKQKQRLNAFLASQSTISKPKTEKQPAISYTVPTKTAELALQGFMPFGNDLTKQERYKKFLQEIIEASKSEVEVTKPVLSEAEANETREFAKAALLYRPSANMISTRFMGEGKGVVEDLSKAPVKEIVYGKDTRSVYKWKPNKTLCRRFAVRFVETSDIDSSDDDAEQKEVVNKETMQKLLEERDRLLETGEIGMKEDVLETDLLTKDDMMEQLQEEDERVFEEEEAEKPSLELFKAIFADSDESDSDLNPFEGVKEKIETKPVKKESPNLPIKEEPVDLKLPKWGPAKPIEIPVLAEPAKSYNVQIPTPVAKEEETFRPVFSKPTVKPTPLNKPRSKQKRPIISAPLEEESEKPIQLPKKKPRPSAADYM